jgi:hypothetical protein
MVKNLLRTLIVTTLALWPAVGGAGVVVEMETREAGVEGAVLSRGLLWVQGDRLRFDPVVDADGKAPQSILFLASEQRMLSIDHTHQWYGEMNPVLLQAVKAQLADALKEVERQLAQIPDEQRAAVEARIREQLSPSGQALPEREIQRTEDKRQLGTYPVVRYVVLEDGEKVRDIWVTEWSNVPEGEELRQGFEAMEGFVRQMVTTLAELPRMESLIQRMGDNMLKELTSLPGLPVLSVGYENGQAVKELAVTAVKKTTVAPEELAPPADYSSRNMFAGASQ